MLKLSFDQISSLSPDMARAGIAPFLCGHLKTSEQITESIRARVQQVLDSATDAEISETLRAYGEGGSEYRLYPASLVARRISRAFMAPLLPEAELFGLHHLRESIAAGPTLMLANHLAYADTQATDHLLAISGAEDIADSIVAVAGPKVYSDPFRRVAAISLSTLKTAQSSSLAHNEAGLSPREVGRIAVETVYRAGELMAKGHPILVYAEGARSRTGRLQPFLKAVSKYAGLPDVRVVPVAIWGTEAVFPVGSEHMLAATGVGLAFGDAVVAADFGRKKATEECWRRLADCLPEAYGPAPGTPPLA